MLVKEERPDDHHDQRDQEHKNGDAVDPVHVFDPSAPRSIRIFLLDIKVFRYLSPWAHTAKVAMIVR
jgi:hypothetical protein